MLSEGRCSRSERKAYSSSPTPFHLWSPLPARLLSLLLQITTDMVAHSSPGFLCFSGSQMGLAGLQSGVSRAPFLLGGSRGDVCPCLQLRAATCVPGPVTSSLCLHNQQHCPSDSSVITSLGRQPGKILFVGSTR